MQMENTIMVHELYVETRLEQCLMMPAGSSDRQLSLNLPLASTHSEMSRVSLRNLKLHHKGNVCYMSHTPDFTAHVIDVRRIPLVLCRIPIDGLKLAPVGSLFGQLASQPPGNALTWSDLVDRVAHARDLRGDSP